MTTSPTSPIDVLFEQMVGSPESRAEYYSTLSSTVVLAQQCGTDAYRALADVNNLLVQSTLGTLVSAEFSSKTLDKLADSASIGQKTHMGCLAALGALYEDEARDPQEEQTVRSSIDAVNRHVFSIAFSGGVHVGRSNIRALNHGTNPIETSGAGPMIQLTPAALAHLGRQGISLESFDTTNIDGQIKIKPKFDVLKDKDSNSVCPATVPRVKVDGTIRSALFTSIEIASEVVLRKIYTRLPFGIMFNEATPAPKYVT